MDIDDDIVAIFLDLSKAFDKVWHKGLIFKLHRTGIRGNLLLWLKSYLTNRKQCVVLNGCKSDILSLHSGIPQGSVLGPLLFLIYINDICDNLTGDPFLFADDCSLIHKVRKNITRCIRLVNSDLHKINAWAEQWLVTINATKTVTMLFSKSRPNMQLPPVILGNSHLTQVFSHTHLGLKLTPTLSWQAHITELITKANKRLLLLKKFKYRVSRKTLQTCYFSFVRSLLEYGDILLDSCSQKLEQELEAVQINAAQIVTGAKRNSSHEELYKELGWQPLQRRRHIHKLTKMHDIVNNVTPKYIHNLIDHTNTRDLGGFTNGNLKNFRTNTTLFEKSFFVDTIKNGIIYQLVLRKLKQNILLNNMSTIYLNQSLIL